MKCKTKNVNQECKTKHAKHKIQIKKFKTKHVKHEMQNSKHVLKKIAHISMNKLSCSCELDILFVCYVKVM